MSGRAFIVLIAGASVPLSACQGVIQGMARDPSKGRPSTASTAGGTGGSGNSGGVVVPPTPVVPSPRTVIHRLNTNEYNNTLHDLLGTAVTLPDSFPPDDTAYGFDNVAEVLSLTDVHLDAYQATARSAIVDTLAGTRRAQLLPCNLTTGQETCVQTALQAFLPRAWRAPVADADVGGLVALFTAAKAGGNTDDDAFTIAAEAALVSPRFLFRMELDATGAPAMSRPLDGYELASRLSYFLWSSMPDDELFRAAGAGELADTDLLRDQVYRMLSDPRAHALIDGFGAQWLPVRMLDVAAPDKTVFPAFNDVIRSAMKQETLSLFSDIVSGALPANRLLTPGYSYLTDKLAAYYGLPAVTSTTPVKTTVPPARDGVLTQGTFLTTMAHPNETAPVLRGKWMLSQLLCLDIPPPPPNVPAEPPPVAGQSRRDSLASHRTDPVCSSCHSLMDPLGLAFENYDGVGRYRATDNGVPILTADMLPDGRSFSGPQDLAAMLAADPKFPACLTRQVFTYGLGRAPEAGTADDQVLADVSASFAAGGQHFPDLVETVVLSDVFRQTGVEVTP